MIISYDERQNTINLRWRDEEGNRQQKSVDDFHPYFYVDNGTLRPNRYEVKTRNEGRNVSFFQKFTYDERSACNLRGRPLTKVIVTKPNDVPTTRKIWGRTYEADVPYTHRYAIDELKEIPEYDLRKWYWDMEWMTTGEHEGAITTISIYDNYDEEFTTFVWFPKHAHPDAHNMTHWKHPREGVKQQSDNHYMWYFSSEKEMLEVFVTIMQEQDPDMLIAWYGLQADVPKLIERLHHNGMDVTRLSPYGDIKGFKHNLNMKIINDYSPIEQPIRGRLCLNLDHAFQRQWNDAQRGTLPSMALDFVGNLLFGEGKKKDSKFTDKNEFFRRAWLEDTQNYLDYNIQDVELIRRIDEEYAISEAVLALQRLLVAPFDACFYASHMANIYFMRHATWKVPTGKRNEEPEEITGAMIFDPKENGTNGLYLNVAALDFAGLYPSMMLARNISWETKSKERTEFGANLKTPRDFSKCTETNMRYYKTDHLGLLPRSVLKLKQLRDEYKQRMKDSETEEERIKWYNNQMAVKRLSASFYGVTAFPRFGWYDSDIANSITASAREAIRKAAQIVEGI